MSVETIAEPDIADEPPILTPFPKPRWGRVLYGLFVTALPAFSFWAIRLLKPEWQNGELSSYITLLLFPEASLLFFPLLAYSIISYLLLLLDPTRYSESFVIRFGIYTGVLLALQYSILLLIYSIGSFAYVIVLIWIFPFVFLLIFRWANTKWDASLLHKTMIALATGAYLISAVVMRDLRAPLFFVLIVLVMAAPFWSFLLAVQASVWLIKNCETKIILPRGLGLTAWLGTYIVAWRFDILKMYELYAALPPTPPDCYIATAAARGHPWFVRSWTVQYADGRFMQVNRQLQWLKCAELTLLTIHPRLHNLLRKIYDTLGTPLARRIRNLFIADMAYLLLKPWEWLAELILKTIVPEIDSISKKLYAN